MPVASIWIERRGGRKERVVQQSGRGLRSRGERPRSVETEVLEGIFGNTGVSAM
jgi:hypothetical protein